MDGYQILNSIKSQRDEINELRQLPPGTHEFKSWIRGTKNALDRCFGNRSDYATAFSKINYQLLTSSSSTPESVFQLVYLKGLDEAQVLLQTIIDRYKEYDKDDTDSEAGPAASAASAPISLANANTATLAGARTPAPVLDPAAQRTGAVNVPGFNVPGLSAKTATPGTRPSETLSLIELICLRFNLVSRQLRDRHNQRASLEIEDEYDVQDLFLALLKLHFPETSAYTWTPACVGGTSRRSGLIESEGIMIDVKKTSPSLKPADFPSRISTDLAHYNKHPGCKQLVCFIYDPEGRVGNPAALERELEALSKEQPLKVIIAPRNG